MMRWIVKSSITFRLLVVAAAAATLAVGVSQLHKAPVEVLPDFTPTTVEVQTEALGLSAAEVEQLVTVPMEQDLLNGVAFLKDIRSQSVPGLSRILMIFEPGTPLFKARQVVAERLTQTAALPQVSKAPAMLQPLSSTNRVLMVGMSSKTLTAMQMGVLARWTIAPRLVGVPGVANVSVWGLEDRQLQVQVDPARLRAQGVTLDQVISTSANALWVSPLTFVEASTPGTGGFIDTPNQRIGVQHESPIVTAGDLGKVRVEGTKNLVLGDVGSVVQGHQPLIGDAVVDGHPGMLLVIQRFPGANVRDVTRNVEQAVNDMGPGLKGIAFDTRVYRPATYVEKSLDNLTVVVIVGMILLALVLGAFFFRWQTALVGIVVVPLSMLVALLVLWAFGSTLNAMILAGLAAAVLLVIDDAVVSVENTSRRLREQQRGGNGQTVAKTVLDAVLEMRRPTLYATLIIGLAVLPVFFLERLSGAFFPDIAAAFLLALVASLVVALTVTPALSVLLLSRMRTEQGEEEREVEGADQLGGWLHRHYGDGLSRVINKPRVAYVAVGAMLVLAAVTAPFLGQSLLPTFKENNLLIQWDGPPGTSLPEMERVTALASNELRSIPGVRDVGAHVGRAILGDQVVGANAGELWVSIDPGADYDATVASVKRAVAGYPGFSRSVQTYSQDRVNEARTGTKEDVVVRVYGEDLDTLGEQAANVRRAMSGIDGVTNASVLLPAEEPTLKIRVDLAKADEYGIKPGDVRRAATTLLSGLVVGNLFDQQKVFDVVVRGTPGVRDNLTSIRQLLIDTPEGGHARLGDVADVRIAPSPGIINRQNVSRYVDVGASVAGRDRDAVVRDVESSLQGLRFPIEYHAEVRAAVTQPTWRLISIAVAAVIAMFLLLQVLLGSWRLATLATLTLPLGVMGALVAVLAGGGTLSFGSYIGLFAIFGLAARTGLLLFDRIRRLEADEGEAFGTELIVSAARERLAPVAMTTLTAGLVSVAVLILGSRPGLELLHPIAVVFVGGLITTVALNVLVLPVLYARFGVSRAAEREEAGDSRDFTAVLDELARGGVAGGVAAPAVPAVTLTQTHAVPPEVER
jgi:CzcA family heavy metal efflux pump